MVEAVQVRFISPYGLAPTLVGLAGLAVPIVRGGDDARRRTSIVLLALGSVTLVAFSVVWLEPDEYRFLVMLDVVLAAGLGMAWDGARRWIRQWAKGRWLWLGLQGAMALAALGAVPGLARANLEGLESLRDGYADKVSLDILSTVESRAVVYGSWVLGWPLRYYNTVEGLRPDVEIVIARRKDEDEAKRLIGQGVPVYFRDRMYGLDWDSSPYGWATIAGGGLYRASPEPLGLAHVREVAQTLTEDITLLSVASSAWPLRPDTFTRLAFSWESERGAVRETRLALELVGSDGITRWHHSRPVRLERSNLSPRTDVYLVTPPTLHPGDYALRVALEDPQAGGVLGEVQVEPVPVRAGEPLMPERLVMENPMSAPRGVPSPDAVVRMLGYGYLEGTLWVGHHLVPLSLYWQVVRTSEAPPALSLALVRDGERYLVATDCSVPVSYEGALVESACVLQVPGSAPLGDYLFTVLAAGDGYQEEIPLQKVEVRDRPHTYRVPRMQHAVAARLGENVELLGYDLAPSSLCAAEDLEVTLYWRAGGPTERWLKVFTHAIGSDGSLLGQHDGVPAEGRAPTSEWVQGEIVTDRHVIYVPEGASSGECTVFVGMYAADTGDRLRAVDSDGRPYPDDAVPLGPVVIDRAEGN
jgi:hypothetical protein